MVEFFRHLFPYHRFKYSNKAIKVLIISDTIFFSGMGLVDIVFSVFIISKIPGATLVHLGIGHAIFMIGIILSEPVISKYYDKTQDKGAAFYGFVFGNLLKSVFRILFVFMSSVGMFYVVYFLLGIVHAIEFPAFSKIFSEHIDKGFESTEWSFKDLFVAMGKVLTFFLSGYIATYLGYNFLFILSAVIMFLAGVLYPLFYKKEFI